MTNSTQTRSNETGTKSKAEREAEARAARRAEQAGIVAGLQSALEENEQLLGFARGIISGGFQGKFNVGMESFFAPYVNIGLTERRFVLQHIRPDNGKPNEMMPHFFPLGDVAAVTFADIETFGAEPACRLVIRLKNGRYSRLKLVGALNFETAKALAEVFTSLIGSQRSVTTPTQRTCSQCTSTLDQYYKFCPYCGAKQPEETGFTTGFTQEAAGASTDIEIVDTEVIIDFVNAVSESDFAPYQQSEQTEVTPPDTGQSEETAYVEAPAEETPHLETSQGPETLPITEDPIKEDLMKEEHQEDSNL